MEGREAEKNVGKVCRGGELGRGGEVAGGGEGEGVERSVVLLHLAA